MHIAIDDSYGPSDITPTRYVTGDRRTAIAIAIPDEHVDSLRHLIRTAVVELNTFLTQKIDRLHFVDIFNRNNQWSQIEDESNIELIELFKDLYFENRWKVHVTTIDDVTIRDIGDFPFHEKIDRFDLSNRAHQATIFLLCKIQTFYKDLDEQIYIHIDEGIYKPESEINLDSFIDTSKFTIKFQSSKFEPLLQMADFMAYSINRVTHLSIKQDKSDFDLKIINLLSSMHINSDDMYTIPQPEDLTPDFVDKMRDIDRINKGLPLL